VLRPAPAPGAAPRPVVPPGRWYNVLTGAELDGGAWDWPELAGAAPLVLLARVDPGRQG
jgi:hypothetical protein